MTWYMQQNNCCGYEIDIMHFSIGNAIPGRLYGGNPTVNGEGNGGDRLMSSRNFASLGGVIWHAYEWSFIISCGYLK